LFEEDKREEINRRRREKKKRQRGSQRRNEDHCEKTKNKEQTANVLKVEKLFSHLHILNNFHHSLFTSLYRCSTFSHISNVSHLKKQPHPTTTS
jgi:hypothetical protein